jgi:hypothetical protein
MDESWSEALVNLSEKCIKRIKAVICDGEVYSIIIIIQFAHVQHRF